MKRGKSDMWFPPFAIPPQWPFPTLVQFDFKKCFDDIMNKYQNLDIQDLVRSFVNVYILSSQSERDLFKKFTTGSKDWDGYVYDTDYRYYINYSKYTLYLNGWWWTVDNKYQGLGLFSFVERFKGCSNIEAFKYVAGLVNVNILNNNVNQCEKLDRFGFIHDSYAYHSVNTGSVLSGILYEIIPGIHNVYPFCNNSGKHLFYLFEWSFARGFVRLFRTLQKDNFTDEVAWIFMSPPPELMIFNFDYIVNNINYDVHIHDNISIAYHSRKENAVNTWSGDLSISSSLKWGFLEGRNVKYVFDKNNPDSFEIGEKLYIEFLKMGTVLKLQYVSDYLDYHEEKFGTTIAYHGVPGITIAEFYDYAKLNHPGLDLDPHKNDVSPRPISIQELPFMVKDLFGERQFVLIWAKEKVGKTIFAMDLALMVATGESFSQLSCATEGYKALFIDAEIGIHEMVKRLNELSVKFKNKERISDNFDFRCVAEIGKKLNISTPDDQKWVESQINGAQLIVFDNLGRLLPRGDEKNDKIWGLVFDWFESLKSKGITVILIHHLNKDGKHIGSSKIPHDADLVLTLKRPKKPIFGIKRIIVNIEARKLREDLCEPFTIEYHDKNSNFARTATGKRFEAEEPADEVGSVEVMPLQGLPPLEAVIMKYAKATNVKFVVAQLFKKPSAAHEGTEGYPPSSVTAAFKSLCIKKLLVLKGDRKGAKYYLPDNVPPSDIQLPDDAPEFPSE